MNSLSYSQHCVSRMISKNCKKNDWKDQSSSEKITDKKFSLVKNNKQIDQSNKALQSNLFLKMKCHQKYLEEVHLQKKQLPRLFNITQQQNLNNAYKSEMLDHFINMTSYNYLKYLEFYSFQQHQHYYKYLQQHNQQQFLLQLQKRSNDPKISYGKNYHPYQSTNLKRPNYMKSNFFECHMMSFDRYNFAKIIFFILYNSLFT